MKIIHIIAPAIIILGGSYVATQELNDPIEKVLGAGVLMISTGYAAYLGTYWQEKGKNLATKEDIEVLTTITKKIEAEFDIANENRLTLQSLRRTAIIDVHNGITQIISNLFTDWFGSFELKKRTKYLLDLQESFLRAQSQLELFDENYQIYSPDLSVIMPFIVEEIGRHLAAHKSYLEKTQVLEQTLVIAEYSQNLVATYDKLLPHLENLTGLFRENLKQMLPRA
ncbi:hypothetical protein SAMN04488109_3171 [Chryseolinea serpens]|uniref:Uncharacterized protein n=1 Tax=Chryseolinea serpens TaxID=947013 RepID=A0A1M5R4A2_9BACT|nr:hypothetical protein [Chryseolinea serpens]SHH20860.1 hypothetical protein SAMN04488109_3171 [Chryseolinea serpens]